MVAGDATPGQVSPMSRQPRCLDCAAVLHADPATGVLVDGWGERICQASYRVHVPDLSLLEVDRPAAGIRPPMPDPADEGGAGAYRRRLSHVKAAPASPPRRTRPPKVGP
jgi:hypothetical protein